MPIRKPHLRALARGRRDAMHPGDALGFSRAIHRHLLSVIDGEDPVLVYVSKKPEVDTLPLISAMLEQGKCVVVPIIEKEKRTLRLSYLRDLSDLSVSTFSVPEPIGHEIPADPGDIMIVLIPMIAFDRQGHRLGYGAGYYDRFLSRFTHMKKIGVAFSCQEIEFIPADKNDVRMDLIVTEKGIIRVSSPSPD